MRVGGGAELSGILGRDGLSDECSVRILRQTIRIPVICKIRNCPDIPLKDLLKTSFQSLERF